MQRQGANVHRAVGYSQNDGILNFATCNQQVKKYETFVKLKSQLEFLDKFNEKFREVPWYGQMGQPHVMLSCRGRHFGIS